MFVCPSSVCRHGRTRLPLDGFSWNFIFEYFSKISREMSSFMKIRPDILHEGLWTVCGPGREVGIGRSGDRIPVGARFSAPVQTGPGAHPASSTMGNGSFPGVKTAGAWRSPLTPSSAVVMKAYSHTSTPSMGLTACTEPQCLYKGDLYLFTFKYCMTVSRSLLLRMRCVSDKSCRENPNTHFMLVNLFFPKIMPFVRKFGKIF